MSENQEKKLDLSALPRQAAHPNLIATPKGSNNGGGARKGKKMIGSIFRKVLSYRCPEDLTMLGLCTIGIPEEDLNLLTNEEVIALQIVSKALRGDTAAAAMIYDRVEGKPVQKNENMNADVSYTEFLEHLAEEEKAAVEELLA